MGGGNNMVSTIVILKYSVYCVVSDMFFMYSVMTLHKIHTSACKRMLIISLGYKYNIV